VSALGLALIIAGKATAAQVPIWEAPPWMNHLTMTIMLPSVILFGGIGAFTIFDMWSANRRGAQNSDKKVPLYMDVLLISVGLIVYGAITYLHPYMFGVAVLP
jgi:uncharacterized membrane protein